MGGVRTCRVTMAQAQRVHLTILALLLLAVSPLTGAQYIGKRIGALSQLQHDVAGEVYAVDSRTIHIKGFSYDGAAPDAFFYGGRSGVPSDDGFIIPDENGSTKPLGRYRKKDVTLTLPEGMTLKDVKWISVWCRAFAIDFGHVTLPASLQYPRPQKINALTTLDHGVTSDRIVVVDAQTFLIPNFNYDGAAPDAHFWVGRGAKPGPDGTVVPDENGSTKPLKRYEGKTIVITLPDSLTIFDIDYLSVWCKAFFSDFGNVRIPSNLNVPPSLKMLGVAPQSGSPLGRLAPTSQHSSPSLSPQSQLAPVQRHRTTTVKPTTFRPSANFRLKTIRPDVTLRPTTNLRPRTVRPKFPKASTFTPRTARPTTFRNRFTTQRPSTTRRSNLGTKRRISAPEPTTKSNLTSINDKTIARKSSNANRQKLAVTRKPSILTTALKSSTRATPNKFRNRTQKKPVDRQNRKNVNPKNEMRAGNRSARNGQNKSANQNNLPKNLGLNQQRNDRLKFPSTTKIHMNRNGKRNHNRTKLSSKTTTTTTTAIAPAAGSTSRSLSNIPNKNSHSVSSTNQGTRKLPELFPRANSTSSLPSPHNWNAHLEKHRSNGKNGISFGEDSLESLVSRSMNDGKVLRSQEPIYRSQNPHGLTILKEEPSVLGAFTNGKRNGNPSEFFLKKAKSVSMTNNKILRKNSPSFSKRNSNEGISGGLKSRGAFGYSSTSSFILPTVEGGDIGQTFHVNTGAARSSFTIYG